MKLLSKNEETTKREIFQIEKDGEEYTLIWYIEGEGYKVIDRELRDKDGISVQDPALLAEIELWIENNETIQDPLDLCDMD